MKYLWQLAMLKMPSVATSKSTQGETTSTYCPDTCPGSAFRMTGRPLMFAPPTTYDKGLLLNNHIQHGFDTALLFPSLTSSLLIEVLAHLHACLQYRPVSLLPFLRLFFNLSLPVSVLLPALSHRDMFAHICPCTGYVCSVRSCARLHVLDSGKCTQANV